MGAIKSKKHILENTGSPYEPLISILV